MSTKSQPKVTQSQPEVTQSQPEVTRNNPKWPKVVQKSTHLVWLTLAWLWAGWVKSLLFWYLVGFGSLWVYFGLAHPVTIFQTFFTTFSWQQQSCLYFATLKIRFAFWPVLRRFQTFPNFGQILVSPHIIQILNWDFWGCFQRLCLYFVLRCKVLYIFEDLTSFSLFHSKFCWQCAYLPW